MISREIADECKLSDDELRELFSPQHLETMVLGYMVHPGVLGGILLRARDPQNPGTRVFYRCQDYRQFNQLIKSRWCIGMRGDSRLCRACEDSDEFAFEVAEECATDPNWSGFAYICKGGLIDFVVPIRVPATGDFIGVAFHGQFRPFDKDIGRVRERLSQFRHQVAHALGISDELDRFDAIPTPSKADIDDMESHVRTAAHACSGRIGDGQGHILAIPLSRMLDEYVSAPMLKCREDVFVNLPGTRHAWHSDKARREAIKKSATLSKVDFQPVSENGQSRNDFPNMLSSCIGLANLVAQIATSTADMKIERYVTNRIVALLVGAEDLVSFWALAKEIVPLLASWMAPAGVIALRFENDEGKGHLKVNELFRASEPPKSNPSLPPGTFVESTAVDTLAEFTTTAAEIGPLVEMCWGPSSNGLPFCALNLRNDNNGTAESKGMFICVFRPGPNDPQYELSRRAASLGIIARTMNERFAQILSREALGHQVVSHKKALLCITHSIQRPLVDISGGVTYLRSFGDITNNVKHWLTHVKHATEDAQIIAGCTARIFRAVLRNEAVPSQGKEDLIDVAAEIQALAKRLRLFESTDDERNVRPNKKNLTVEYCQTVKRVTVRADRHTFVFVIYNLLDNAIKYSKRNEVITIEYGTEFAEDRIGRQLCLKVKTFGERIPISLGQEDLPFEMFWRGQDQPIYEPLGRTYYPGLGVGLWASRLLLESQGGKIWLVPQDEGWPHPRLNVFAVRFPRCQVAE